MKSLSGKELAKMLERDGWTLARIHGSHHIYVKEGRRERISIPIHGNRSLKKGLSGAILRIAGIELKEES